MSTPRKSHRRDFLRGRAALDAAQDLVDQLPLGGDSGPPAPSAEASYLLRYSRRAMACDFEVILNAGQYPQHAEAALAALDLVEALEAQLSSYREQSEISRLNRTAAAAPIEVEPRLWQLFASAVEWSKQTGGAYDITAGPLSRVWGFMHRAGAVPAPERLAEALARVGSQHLLLDPVAWTARFAVPGMELNLGGIGKGYALDRCGEIFANMAVSDYLLHGGQSSLLARGSQASTPGSGWRVGICDPLRPHQRLTELWLKDRAISTSSAGLQHFVHQGRKYGHLLDPRTGWPAEGLLSVTVLATTAAEAEAFSTACYVLGLEESRRLCRDRADLAAVLIAPGTRAGSVAAYAVNLTEDDFAAPLDQRDGAGD